MDPLTPNVLKRLGFKYQPKETKTHRVDKVTVALRAKTGLSKSMAEAISDALVRGRDVQGLAIQKKWPIEDGVVKGPSGEISLRSLM